MESVMIKISRTKIFSVMIAAAMVMGLCCSCGSSGGSGAAGGSSGNGASAGAGSTGNNGNSGNTGNTGGPASGAANGAASGSNGGASEGMAGAASNGHEPLSITSFNNIVTEEFIDAVHEVYPDINFDIISYAGKNGSGYAQFSLEEGDIPDIYVSTLPFAADKQAEYLADLSNYDFINQYSTAMLNALDHNGSIYLLPSGYTVAGITYNKTLMEEHGWKVPESLEELEALVPEIEKAGLKPFANAMELDGFPFNFFFSAGNTVWFGSQDGVQWKNAFPKGEADAVSAEGLKDVIDLFQRYIDDGIISSENTPNDDYFVCGDTVFDLNIGISHYSYTDDAGHTYEFGIMPWLSPDGSNNMLTRNVSRYFGVSKELEKPGNEQKLKDALDLMRFIASPEGQNAILGAGNIWMSPLNGAHMDEEHPYYEVADVINSGHTVQMVYVGWEDLIIPIAQDIRKFISGELSGDELAAAFDETYKEVSEGTTDDYGVLTETLDIKQTAELNAIAEGIAADADCAIVSLNKYHGDGLTNKIGVSWHLYASDIDMARINMVAPNTATISVLELTGAEIRAIAEAGFDADGNGIPYEYVLVTKQGSELEDGKTYRLAFPTGSVIGHENDEKLIEISAQTALGNYTSSLGTFDAADISWQ